jgi:hypothetical protein
MKGFPEMVSVVESISSASLADYVRSAAAALSPDLIGVSQINDIRDVMTPFPAALSVHSMFECRLGSPVPSSDYSIMMSAADGGQTIVGGLHRNITLPDLVHQDVRWAPVMNVLQEWGRPESSFFRQFDHIWLEFDVSGEPASRTVPSVFFSPRNGGRLGAVPGGDGSAAQGARNLIIDVVEMLADGELGEGDADRLRQGMERLPAGAFLFQVGVMCGRRPASVRLLLSHISPSNLITFLRDIGWDGNRDRLLGEIDQLSPRLDGLTYGIEIHNGVGARVGIECYIRNDDWRKARDRWPTFIAHLVDRGLCLPEKGDGLVAYQGISHQGDGADPWPGNLAAATM